jgi:phage shock protein C
VRDRLRRSRTERMFLGVCGGIAEWLDLDPVLVRVAFVLFTFAGGFGVLLYIVLAFVVPEERDDETFDAATPPLSAEEIAARHAAREARRAARAERRASSDRRGGMIFGAVLIVLGGWFLLRQYVPSIPLDDLWPLLLVILGGVLILGSLRTGSSS